MKPSADIYKELKEITPFLAELERINVFSVPENYFSGLATEILEKINPDRFKVLPASEPLFSLPEGYFENLAGDILQKIKILESDDPGEELKQLSPVLYAEQNKNVFTVPPQYFETLPDVVINIVRPRAKVVAMKKRNMVWNCVAAAVITGVMAISALWTSNTPTGGEPQTAANKNIPLNIKDALQYKNEQQINEGIAHLSDADIIRYLEATGGNADDEALASGIPEKELPDEQDYLTNENTLQIFFGKADSRTNQN